MTALIFLIFAAIAVFCGISLVVQTHPIASALSLIGVMGSLAVLYLLLGGEFIAAAQVIVYAGAIMVLFVFVIMLLNAGAEAATTFRSRFVKYLGASSAGRVSRTDQLHHSSHAAEDRRCDLRRLPGHRGTSDENCSPLPAAV
jgi:NADH:ubiquinone oxidoreductase subunit 6 (subunit J)